MFDQSLQSVLMYIMQIPFSSANPMIDNLLKDYKKRRIIVLNKSDLSNPRLQRVRGALHLFL